MFCGVGHLDEQDVRFLGPPSLDVAVSELARRQHGVVALEQLVALGLSARAVQQRAARGRLHRLHRGVYAVGHTALAREGRWLAAVLACGEGAALSHRSGGALHSLRQSSHVRIEVTAPRGRKGPSAVDVHRSRNLPPHHVTTVDGIPVTTPARTLVDLADVLSPQALARAVHEAEVLRLLDVDAVHEALEGRRGARLLRPLLATPEAPSREEFVRRFAALCRRERLPLPSFNAYVELPDRLTEVDAIWREQRVIAELDGAAVHLTRRAFEADRAKDLALAAEGYLVVRITWRRLIREPRAVACGLRRILDARPA